jgi:hypothetical protein
MIRLQDADTRNVVFEVKEVIGRGNYGNNKILDWKDNCDAQFSKAVALAIAIMLLIYLVAPKTETQTKKEIISQVEIAEAPPDTRQKEETQTETEIDIDIPVISEELATEDTPELAEKRALALQQFGNLQSTTSSTIQQSGEERPFDFVPWDDPPVPIGSIRPVYLNLQEERNSGYCYS